MSSNAEMNGSRFRWGRVVVAVAAAGALLVGCGSGGGDQAAPATTAGAAAPAGAKENAATAPVCFDLYKPTVQVGCAENTIGPGGGVIFYDAKTVQPWGRFLEVAPQKWSGQLFDCPTFFAWVKTCGTADGIEAKTGDFWKDGAKTYFWSLCTKDSTLDQLADKDWESFTWPASMMNLPRAIGAGRANTAAILAEPTCTAETSANGSTSAPQKAASYRGGGLADWFIPSKEELLALCRFGNRNAIGGFVTYDTKAYTSSSTEGGSYDNGVTNRRWSTVKFDDGCGTPGANLLRDEVLVRPIRAF